MARKIKRNTQAVDTTYLLKLVLFIVVGSQWLYITINSDTNQLPIPYGALLAILFTLHEHFKIDRKIDYAVITVSMFIGFWLPMGITIVL